jgi:hypothetical protein
MNNSVNKRSRAQLAIPVAVIIVATAANCAQQRFDEAVLAQMPSAATAEHNSVLTPDRDPQDWVTFHDPDDRFTALFPGDQPAREDDSVKTPIGQQSVIRYKLRSDSMVFDAGYLQRSRHPLAAIVGEQSILASSCEGTASHMGGRIVRSTRIEVDGYPAREIQIDIASPVQHSVAQARLVITPERIYHAIIKLPDGNGDQFASRRFIESLHISGTNTSDSGE